MVYINHITKCLVGWSILNAFISPPSSVKQPAESDTVFLKPSLSYVLILSSHLRLGLQNVFFSSDAPTEMLYAFLIVIRAI